MIQRSAVFVLALAASTLPVSGQVGAQAKTTGFQARITQPIDESRLTVLRGNTHPLARPEFDQGLAPPELSMEHMLLVLSRSSEQQASLETLLNQQQDKSSPQYHKWLSPEQFGEQFGPAEQDIHTIISWLRSNGFQVNRVSNGKTVIDFSGTATQVQNAFHTEIHQYAVNGRTRWANASDPQIPAALAPVVVGVATLHNFAKKPQLISSNRHLEAVIQPGARPQFTSGTLHALAPADYATIYNINPLYQAGVNGKGVTVAVVGRSNINAQDIVSFRSTFGLSNNTPQIVVNGPDPGDLGGDEEAEAVLDTSWSGATAPSATIKLVVSKTTNSSDGVDLSELYIIDNNIGDVMTESFGSCEATDTQADIQAHLSWGQQAAAQGITYLVAAGDSGAEGCDDPTETSATGPLSVNVLASTPYTIAVGGTEFNEASNASNYWNSTNDSQQASAKSYIPEDVWNEACTVAQCGSSNAGLWAGGGGVSTIFVKPAWQTAVAGIPNDGMRDVPDVSLTAAGHDAYLL
jgi:pseudomonalisin